MTECDCPADAGAATCDAGDRIGGGICPSCGARGKRVDLVTVKALLNVPLTEMPHADNLFCRAADCPTVYYSAGGEQVFPEGALRERVHQKHPAEDDVFVCYCFRHTAGGARNQVTDSRGPGVIEAITAGIREGKCACEIRNSQGSCCLGNVRALLNTPA